MSNKEITELQKEILEFAKREYFKVNLQDFIESTRANKEDSVLALKDLKKRRIVSMSSDLMNGYIGVTNYGWNLLGWK